MATIALVDCDPELVSLLRYVLEEDGHEVIADLTPGTVVEELSRHPPDLVILDPWLSTPREGWEILTRLVEDIRTCDVPVIVYTGAIDYLREHEGWLNDHGVASLRKPFELTELEVLVSTALSDTRAREKQGAS